MSFNAPEQHISTKGYISQIHNDEGDEPNVIMKNSQKFFILLRSVEVT